MPTEDADEKPLPDAATRRARIEAMATLPVFFKLGGKRAVVAGGSEAALWKAELLAASGASVDVYADALAEGFHELVASPPSGTIALRRRRWRPDDLDGAAIAVGAMADNAEAAAFAAAARASGVPVNVIDRPEFCDFQFGAIVNRSPLVIAVSTDGAAPVLGQAIRSLVESLLPEGLARWVYAAKSWRQQGDRLGGTMAERRGFWNRFADLAMRDAARPPTEADLGQLLTSAADSRSADLAHGRVTIISVGDADALTLGAVRALRAADSIFYDAGVPAAILGFARREAERRPVTGTLSGGGAPAAEIADFIIAATAAGKRVVWLKIADGSNISSVTEDADTLRGAGLLVDVIRTVGPE
jgi:uroporphyrin-III C-methyltransferase / precorrin-2 dehydrogenase / sirohydrochlorin ferrochelatase